ncbi:hypothetical protein O9G_004491 [Rozella allomycis CSF55]|uniref:Uncharacterized protein n=1 Tax=Rozella allomycis (strain CSF55) TaxID=988480 RepID=A0A075AXA9_ROZAC|nr:hypothetical protein O9G_004491 [Rozella allomycis CSF55]|eukprot:EPZ34779.1 hypothetical protein O9G_004491 [Rozella allomycis CSF55]
MAFITKEHVPLIKFLGKLRNGGTLAITKEKKAIYLEKPIISLPYSNEEIEAILSGGATAFDRVLKNK